MQYGIRAFSLCAAIFFGAVACSDSSTAPGGSTTGGKPASAPAEMAGLVPSDAFLYVTVPSIDRLESAVKRLVGAFDPAMSQSFDLIDALGSALMMPADLDLVDRNRPLGVSFSLNQAAPGPMPVFILPVTDSDAFARSWTGPDPISLGRYVGLSMVPGAPITGEPNPMVADMPDGELALRVDLGRLISFYRPMIEMGLEMAGQMAASPELSASGGFDVAPVIDGYVDGARSLLDSAERLDVALAIHGTRVELTKTLTVFEDSELTRMISSEPTGVADLAGCIGGDEALMFLAGVDMAVLTNNFEPFLDNIWAAYPDPMQAELAATFDDFAELYASAGTAMVGSGGFGPAGVASVWYMETNGGAAFCNDLGELLLAGNEITGMTVEGPFDQTVGGVSVTGFRYAMSDELLASMVAEHDGAPGDPREMMDAIYGEDGFRMNYAFQGDRVALVMGGDEDYLKRSVAGLNGDRGNLPADLADALQRVAASNPSLAFRIDLARFMGDMGRLIAKASPFDEGARDFAAAAETLGTEVTAPMTIYAGAEGRTWSGGLTLDVAELAAFSNRMQTAVNDNAPFLYELR